MDFRPSREWLVEKCNELGNYYSGGWVPIGTVFNAGWGLFALTGLHLPFANFSHRLNWQFLPQSEVRPGEVTLYSGARVENWKRDTKSTTSQIVITYESEDGIGEKFRSDEFELKKGEVLYIIKVRDGSIKLLIERLDLPEWYFKPQIGGRF